MIQVAVFDNLYSLSFKLQIFSKQFQRDHKQTSIFKGAPISIKEKITRSEHKFSKIPLLSWHEVTHQNLSHYPNKLKQPSKGMAHKPEHEGINSEVHQQ